MPADGYLSSRPPPEAPCQIALRRMRFDLDPDVPVHWVADSKFLTHFYNALSVVFPEGEKFFVRSVRQFEDRIEDPELLARVRGFVAQEGHHTLQHRLLNQLVQRHGFDTARYERWLKVYLKVVWALFGPLQRLGLTCALEHYTAILGHQLLSDPRQQTPHPKMLPLWLWHAAEEVEHKAVAFDVFRYAGGGYFSRAMMQVLASLSFFPIVHAIQFLLMRADRSAPTTLRDVLRGWHYLWVNPGGLRLMLPELFAYLRPSFHPWQHDNRALVAAWLSSDNARDHLEQ